MVLATWTAAAHGPWISGIISIRINDSHKSSMIAMRIIDDDVETLLTLDMSIEEDTRRRSLIQQRTDRLLHNDAPCVSEAELHQYSRKHFMTVFNETFQPKVYIPRSCMSAEVTLL